MKGKVLLIIMSPIIFGLHLIYLFMVKFNKWWNKLSTRKGTFADFIKRHEKNNKKRS